VFATLRPYRPVWLTADLLAGLTVWAVLVPESLAYAYTSVLALATAVLALLARSGASSATTLAPRAPTPSSSTPPPSDRST
jgi:sulfate permease, SulP family